MAQKAIPFMQLRGGSSKGIYFDARDLPADGAVRNQILLAAVGSDTRQIDGLGGADPLTSKAAIVGLSTHAQAHIDYLFAQIVVGENRVDIKPTCGNILAGVGPFAIESGLIEATDGVTQINVHMVNTGTLCELLVQTPEGKVNYRGETRIDGVPGTAAPILCRYNDIAGSACGALFPTGNYKDVVDGINLTCIDNGMPVVIMRAEDLDIRGDESPAELNANETLKNRLQSLRLQLGPMMNLGDVDGAAVPKMCMVSKAKSGGVIATRTFIPYQCHSAIGVLGAVSVATACVIPGTIAAEVATLADLRQHDVANIDMSIEHPSGEITVNLQIDFSNTVPNVKKAGVVRTARLLSRGELYIPEPIY